MSKSTVNIVDIPALETTAEGKLRGGFSSITTGRACSCGGQNEECGNNDNCIDNRICYDNSDSEACRGNWSGNCSNNGRATATSTATSTSTSTSTSKLISGLFFSF